MVKVCDLCLVKTVEQSKSVTEQRSQMGEFCLSQSINSSWFHFFFVWFWFCLFFKKAALHEGISEFVQGISEFVQGICSSKKVFHRV